MGWKPPIHNWQNVKRVWFETTDRNMDDVLTQQQHLFSWAQFVQEISLISHLRPIRYSHDSWVNSSCSMDKIRQFALFSIPPVALSHLKPQFSMDKSMALRWGWVVLRKRALPRHSSDGVGLGEAYRPVDDHLCRSLWWVGRSDGYESKPWHPTLW